MKISYMTIICCEFSDVKKDQWSFYSRLFQNGIVIKGGNLSLSDVCRGVHRVTGLEKHPV